MTIEERLTEYLEETIKTDAALKAVYTDDKKRMQDCISYITSMAKGQARGGCACIEDEVVYKWARDFYHGDTEQPAEVVQKPAVVVTKKPEPEPKEEPEKKPARKEDPKQLLMFDMEDDDAETD